MSYLLLVVSLVLLVVGASWLVDGSAAIARRYGISEYIIGATIVGMGTSMPELVVSVISSVEGLPEIAIGNVVGSNIFNVYLILGVTALMMPIKYTRENIRRDIPIHIIVSVFVLVLCALGIYFRGEYGLGRGSGLLLLGGFAYYLWYILRSEVKAVGELTDKVVTAELGRYRSLTVCVLSILVGLGVLILGGDMFVDSASIIAREWGVSEAVIGLTIVAGGTSLPELMSSIVAVTRSKAQMALGNIVGSNIFNLLFILGISSLVQPLSMGEITFVDWGVMLLSSIVLMIASVTFKRRQLDRVDAVIFILIYILYVTWLVMGQNGV